jgi:hypothetical protein
MSGERSTNHDAASAAAGSLLNGPKRMRASSASVPSESRLLELSVPLPDRKKDAESTEEKGKRTERLAAAVRELISCLGEDPEREGLIDTPKRAAEAFMFWTKGYEESLVCKCRALTVPTELTSLNS